MSISGRLVHWIGTPLWRMGHLLRRMKWRWRLLLIGLGLLFVFFVIVPMAVYYSRDRDPSDYSQIPAVASMTYRVDYDSQDGVVSNSSHRLKVIETGVERLSHTCFHAVTTYDPHPERKVNAIIVGTTTVKLGEEELWRSQDDLRLISKRVMQIDLPIVNTAYTDLVYSEYDGYPGWPYHLNDSWTYRVSYDTDFPMQPNWTDTFSAEVVSDDVVTIDGAAYRCFKVLHTLIDTSNGTPPGDGVGSVMTEYWYADARSIGPVMIEDGLNFKGTETQIMLGSEVPPWIEGWENRTP